MIAHVSIPAQDPKATCLLLSALMDGEAFPFPVVPGAWIAVARDGSGQAIEVYPETMAHHPGRGEADLSIRPEGPATLPWEDQVSPDGPQVRPSAFHLALSTPLDADQVLALAREAGLRAVRCERAGLFGLTEVWIDGTLLVEVLGRTDVERYRRFMNPQGVARFFGPSVRPAAVA